MNLTENMQDLYKENHKTEIQKDVKKGQCVHEIEDSTQYCQIVSQIDLQLYPTPVKMPAGFLVKIDKLITKCVLKYKIHKSSKNTSEGK